jgi:hypothetical protein
MSILKTTVVHTLAASLIAGQVGAAAAAPLPTNIAAMKSMVADSAIPVYWRGGWGWGWGVGAGAIAGLIIGGAIASSAYGAYGPYGYPYPYYGGYYGPAYYGYGPYYGYARPYGYANYGYVRPYGYGYARPYGYGYARPYGVYPRPYYRYRHY